MKLRDLLQEKNRKIQAGIDHVTSYHGDVAAAVFGLRFQNIQTILSAYLGGASPFDDLLLKSYDAAKAITSDDPMLSMMQFMMAVSREDVTRHAEPAEILRQAEAELEKRDFVDFAFAGQGLNALVLAGTKGDGTQKALRLFTGHYRRQSSIALLEADEHLFLPRHQSIEILPLADEIGPEREKVSATDPALWNQRVIYLQTLLHYEGLHYWQDNKTENIGMFSGKPFICDPVFNDPEETEGLGPENNKAQIRDLIKSGPACLDPDKDGVITTEFFAGLATDNVNHAKRTLTLAKKNNWHAIDLQDTGTKKHFILVVDPSRQNDEGYQLAKSIRDNLRSNRRHHDQNSTKPYKSLD